MSAHNENEPQEAVFIDPPLLCVEILAPDDRLSRIIQVAGDSIAIGTPSVWVLEPLEKRAFIADISGLREVTGQISTVDHQISLSLDDIFSEEDWD